MRHEIFGGNLPAVTVYLDRGESVYTQSDGMTWMTDGIAMETNMKGGLLKGLGRKHRLGGRLFLRQLPGRLGFYRREHRVHGSNVGDG